MLSRGFTAIKAVKFLKLNNIHNSVSVRHSHDWNYRCGPPPASKTIYLAADIIQGIAWWWVLWHLITEPGHVFGEFDYPDPSKWSDEELGIPPIE